jgi:heme oxygenase
VTFIIIDTEFEQLNRTKKLKEVFEVGWSVFHVDKATKSRITKLTKNNFKINQSINRQSVPNVVKCPSELGTVQAASLCEFTLIVASHCWLLSLDEGSA